MERISRLRSTAAVFLSCASPTACLWLSLLGVLSSLAPLVPGGRLRMQSLQLCLHHSWNRQNLGAPILASMECLRDLQWWLHLPRLSLGLSLHQGSPDLHFWSDASDVGWGAHLDCQVASGLWDTRQAALSINARELLAVQLGLFQFQSALQGRAVAVFCDDTTAVAYLRKESGTRSPLLNILAQEILRWTESLSIRLAPQFLPGSNNVLADTLSSPHQLPHPEWSIHMTVFLSLRRLWPVQMFSLQPRPLIVVRFTSPLSGIRGWQARTRFSSSGTAFRLTRSIRWLSSAYSREAPGLHGDGTHSCGSPLGSALLVFGPGPALAGSSSDPTVPSRPPALASVSSSLPGSPSAQASCLATLQCFPRAAGFSSAIAEQSSLARRPSSGAVYQVWWSIYLGWCHSNGHSVSNPTLAMVADSCITYGTPEALVCPPCVVTVQCSLRFSVFTFRPCLRIRCFGFYYAPSNSHQRSVCYVPILGTCLWC